MGPTPRRLFLLSTGAAAASLALDACARGGQAAPRVTSAARPPDREHEEEEVSPTEDLMREHGVIERILLVYDECARRLRGGAELPVDALTTTANVVRTFVEDYHEKNEEQHVFPRVTGEERQVVKVLLSQHQAGRKITDDVKRLAVPATLANDEARARLADLLASFTRMYRPHAAREDTVVFPAFKRAVPETELDALGERFEHVEHELFGEHGFERIVGQIAEVERALGIHDLARFTPP